MKTITCRKCGNTIDASKGECPICGAMYYIISDEPETDDGTRVWPATETNDNPVFNELDFDTDYDSGIPNRQKGIQPIQQRPAQGQRPPQRQNPAQQRPPQQRRPIDQQRTEGQPRPVQQRQPGQRPQQRQSAQSTKQGAPRRPIDPKQVYRDEGFNGQEKGIGGVDRKVLIVGALALLAALTLVVCFMSGVFSFGDKNAGKMPDVVGLTSENARVVLENIGLKVSTIEKNSAENKGIVIEQSIKEGDKLNKNDSVVLSISNGALKDDVNQNDDEDEDTEVQTPYIVGKTLPDARAAAEVIGLSVVQTSSEYSSGVAEGQIISQTPNSGAYLKKGEAIKVVVSLGVEPTPTPTAYSISVTAGKGGSVSPKGQVSVEEGGSATFTITPEEGYELRELKIDGANVGAPLSYTFSNVKANHTLYAVFQIKTEPTPSPTPSPTPTPTPSPSPTPEMPSATPADGG